MNITEEIIDLKFATRKERIVKCLDPATGGFYLRRLTLRERAETWLRNTYNSARQNVIDKIISLRIKMCRGAPEDPVGLVSGMPAEIWMHVLTFMSLYERLNMLTLSRQFKIMLNQPEFLPLFMCNTCLRGPRSLSLVLPRAHWMVHMRMSPSTTISTRELQKFVNVEFLLVHNAINLTDAAFETLTKLHTLQICDNASRITPAIMPMMPRLRSLTLCESDYWRFSSYLAKVRAEALAKGAPTPYAQLRLRCHVTNIDKILLRGGDALTGELRINNLTGDPNWM